MATPSGKWSSRFETVTDRRSSTPPCPWLGARCFQFAVIYLGLVAVYCRL